MDIILSINVKKIRGQIIYDTNLNENFYLIKINNPPPKRCNNVEIMIRISVVSVEDYT